MWGVPTAFYALVCLLRLAPGVLMNDIMAHYKIDYFKFSLLPALYYIGYASMQLPVSIAMDRFQLKFLMPFLMILTAIGVGLFASSSYFFLAACGSFLIGIGTTIGILGSSSVVNYNFNKNSYSFIFGLTLTVGLLSSSYAGRLISSLVSPTGISRFSWQEFYYLTICLCIVYAILAAVFIKTNAIHAKEEKHIKHIITSLTKVIKNKFLIKITLYCALLTGTIQGLADVWGKIFLVQKFGLEESQSLQAIAHCFLGYAIGAPIIGKIAQKFNKLRTALVICGILISASLLMILYEPIKLNLMFLNVLFFIAGVGSSFSNLTFALVLQKVEKEISNTAIGFSNMGLMAFGFLYHLFIGKFYGVNPLFAVSIVPLGAIVGTTCLTHLFIKE